MRKNVSGQFVCAQMIDASDGSAVVAGSTTVYYSIDNAAQQTGSGTVAHEGNGMWSYAPTQAETNGDHIAWTFANDTPAVSQLVNTYPVSFDYTDAVRIGLTALPNAAADGVGGLPISDAGGLDLDTHIGGLTFTVANQVDANTLALSGSTTASDNVEYVFDTHWATAWDDTTKVWNVSITGTPDVNAIQISGSTTAANNLETAFDTDWANNYANNKLQSEADVIKISGDATAADNLEIFFDGTGYNAANSTVGTVTDVTNTVSADMVSISGDTNSADNLEASTLGLILGTAQTGTLTTTTMTTSLTEGTADHYIGRTILFYGSGSVLEGQATDITDYVGTNGTLTYTTITDAPLNGQKFVIV